jgi:hypothetical protein
MQQYMTLVARETKMFLSPWQEMLLKPKAEGTLVDTLKFLVPIRKDLKALGLKIIQRT